MLCSVGTIGPFMSRQSLKDLIREFKEGNCSPAFQFKAAYELWKGLGNMFKQWFFTYKKTT